MLKRHNFVALIAILKLTAVFAAIAVFGENASTGENLTAIGKSSVTSKVIADVRGTAKSMDITEHDRLMAKNSRFELYLNDADFIVKLKDLSNGYVWSSAVPGEKLSSLNFEWQRIATSFLTSEYINEAGTIKYSPLKHSKAPPPVFTPMPNGFSARVEFYEAQIELTLYVELTDAGFKVRIPDDSIIRKGKNFLHKLHIMPFFGAVLGDEIPGYVMIPDGCGALIRFSKPRVYMSSYSSRVYGPDYGIKRAGTPVFGITQTEGMRLNMPVFGVAHGGEQNAFLAVANSGDSYMEIEVSPAGSTTDFTYVFPKFIYREQYNQPTGKSGSSFVAMQQRDNKVNVEIEYLLLSGRDADYSGMAAAYRNKLIKEGKLPSKIDKKKPVGIKLEVLMAEVSKGILRNKIQGMTNLSDVSLWAKEINNAGVKNISFVLDGFEKGGVNGHRLFTSVIEPLVGNEKQLNLLYDELNNSGNCLILKREIFSGYEHQIDRSRLAYNIDGGLVEKYEHGKPMFNKRYYVNINTIKDYINRFDNLPLSMQNKAFSGIGSELHSDHKRNRVMERADVKNQVCELLESLKNQKGLVALYDPNVYAFKYADVIYDIPMRTSQYIYETDTIPFIQMVLSGRVEYYSPSMNFGTNTITDILKIIDFGAYPAYIVTSQPTNLLAETNSNHIYSSRYVDWKPYIIQNYKYVNSILSAVRGKAMIKRSVPEDGVAVVSYEGGTVIVVNYNDKPYVYDGVIVEALSAKVVKE